jgi:hypothetical protein
MAKLPEQYNTADLPSSKIVLIEPGQYQAVVVDSELKPNSKNDGQYLALTLVITQGQYVNTEFVERLNIIHTNPTTVQMAYKTLARISEAVGMTRTPSDSVELHNKPLIIQVATEQGSPWKDKDGVMRDGSDKSVIKKYLPLPKAAGAFSTAAPQAVAQGQASVATPPWASR